MYLKIVGVTLIFLLLKVYCKLLLGEPILDNFSILSKKF